MNHPCPQLARAMVTIQKRMNSLPLLIPFNPPFHLQMSSIMWCLFKMNHPRPQLARAMVEHTLQLLNTRPPKAVDGDVAYVSEVARSSLAAFERDACTGGEGSRVAITQAVLGLDVRLQALWMERVPIPWINSECLLNKSMPTSLADMCHVQGLCDCLFFAAIGDVCTFMAVLIYDFPWGINPEHRENQENPAA
eukprot:1160317-Pelagomonas_calceolata.AAC.17